MYYVYDAEDRIVYSTKSPVDAYIHASLIDDAHIDHDEWAK